MGGLISFEIPVGDRQRFGFDGKRRSEFEDGDRIVFGDGGGSEADASVVGPQLEARVLQFAVLEELVEFKNQFFAIEVGIFQDGWIAIEGVIDGAEF